MQSSSAICYHQTPQQQCLHCLRDDLERLKAERQRLRVAVYGALDALLHDDLDRAAHVLCEVTGT